MRTGEAPSLGVLVESRLRDRERESFLIARNALADLAVCIFRTATSALPVARNVVKATDEGPYPILGWGRNAVWHDAVFANAFLAHLEDFDDHSVSGVVHSSACIVPPLLMAFASRKCSGITLVRAFTHASEACLTIGERVGEALYAKGWFNTTLLGVFGACTAQMLSSGRLIAPTIDQAFELARGHAFGTRHVLGSWGKPLAVGKAAMLGASLGRLGIRMGGIPAIPDRGRPDLFELAGASWKPVGSADNRNCRLLDPGLEMKPLPLCLSAYPYVDLGRMLRQEVPQLAGLGRYDVECSPRASMNLSFSIPSTSFDLPFSALAALAFGYLQTGDEAPEHASLTACMNEMAAKLGQVNIQTDWEKLPFRAAVKGADGHLLQTGGAESPAVSMRDTEALRRKVRTHVSRNVRIAEALHELLESTEPGAAFDRSLRALLN